MHSHTDTDLSSRSVYVHCVARLYNCPSHVVAAITTVAMQFVQIESIGITVSNSCRSRSANTTAFQCRPNHPRPPLHRNCRPTPGRYSRRGGTFRQPELALFWRGHAV